MLRFRDGTRVAGMRRMAEICRFYGIVINMFRESAARHHVPHFHARYGEWSASIDIVNLHMLGGHLPAPQRRLVDAWAEIHREELIENWALLHSGQSPFKIEPLK